MFSMDYSYQKGGPEYHCTYPKVGHRGNNIFIIKGKNDTGKSTLMQMVALGLHGLESDDIDELLKEKMQRLISPDVDKCEFIFTILSKDGGERIVSELKRGQIKMTIDEKVRSATFVKDRLKILFDIPEDPIRKLVSALKSVEENLEQYDTYAQRSSRSLQDRIDRIQNYLEKEERLKNERAELGRLTETGKGLDERLSQVSSALVELEREYIVKKYTELASNIEGIDASIKELDKRAKIMKQAGAGGGSPSYRRKLAYFGQALSDLRFAIGTGSKVKSYLSDKERKEFSSMMRQMNEVEVPKDLTDRTLQNWHGFFSNSLSRLGSKPRNQKELQEEDEMRLLQKLIEILKEFVGARTTIPGTNGMNVNQFLSELESRQDKLAALLSDKILLDEATTYCENVLKKMDYVRHAIGELPEGDSGKDEETLGQIERQAKNLSSEFDRKIKEVTLLEDQYEGMGSLNARNY